MRILILLVAVLVSGLASAQPLSVDKIKSRCSSILNGPIGGMIANGVRADKERIYAAPLLKQTCPEFDNLATDAEKVKAVQALLAAYSYAETNCNKTAKMAKDNHSGLFWQLSANSDRQQIKDTPCGYMEATEANQVRCALYALNPVGKLPVLEQLEARVKGFPRSIQSRFQKTVVELMPACRDAGVAQPQPATSPTSEPPPVIKED
jgi:hypothetical protein